ncbi:MAG: metallophosphoesterase [Bacteroidetes bacterium]|nr:metallophosphoesterase [Bacteroidota bacterium]
MRVYFPIIFSMVVLAVLSGLEILLLKKLHPDWWRYRAVRRLSYGLPIAGITGLALWALGIAFEADVLVSIGAPLTTAALVLGLALMISLPLSAIFHTIDRFVAWFARRRSASNNNDDIPRDGNNLRDDSTLRDSNNLRDGGVGEADAQVPDLKRRKILTTTAAIFPVLAITAGGTGLISATRDPRTPVIPLHYPQLPPALEGLRILQITDVHVGLIINFDDVERIVELSATMKPDLVLLTGDFSDDADTYLDALRLVGSIPSRLGSFASIGNHEYFRGIHAVRRAYDQSPIPLLLDSGTTVDVGGTPLYVAGADDPRINFGLPARFYEQSIDAALQDMPSQAFSLLLCHRPDGFNAAARAGVDLTLSGHTHGGQIGFNGRSVLNATLPEKYMWGLYEINGSKLNVSSGAGHWFPYRLGCPTEIPLYVLTSRPTPRS